MVHQTCRQRIAAGLTTVLLLTASSRRTTGAADGRSLQAPSPVARLLVALLAAGGFQHTMLVKLTLEAPQGAVQRFVVANVNGHSLPPLSFHQTTSGVEGVLVCPKCLGGA